MNEAKKNTKKRKIRTIFIAILAIIFGGVALVLGINAVNSQAKTTATLKQQSEKVSTQTQLIKHTEKTVAKSNKKSALDSLPLRQLKRKPLKIDDFRKYVKEGKLSNRRARFFEIYSDDEEDTQTTEKKPNKSNSNKR